MTDAISAYNARLEAMAAACEDAAGDAESARCLIEEMGDEAIELEAEEAHLRAAAAFIRSQMAKDWSQAMIGDSALVWLSDRHEWLAVEKMAHAPDRHCVLFPLPQIGGSNE